MKRAYLWLTAAVLAGLVVPLAGGQSENTLGNYARQKRKEKQTEPAPRKVFDNDNLPKDEHISIVGSAPAPDSSTTASTEKPSQDAKAVNADNKSADNPDNKPAGNPDNKPKEITPGQNPEERQAAYGEWQKRIADQKQTLDLLQRERDVLEREYRLRAVAMYADVGNRMRNAAQWDKEDRQYKDQIASKQKALDSAKQQLSDLQEQARKAGVPSKMRE